MRKITLFTMACMLSGTMIYAANYNTTKSTTAPEEFPTGYCEPSKRVNESCGEVNIDNVHTHSIQSLSIKVNGTEVLSLGETKTTFNYKPSEQQFSVEQGQEITFDFQTGHWAENVWIGCDWNRDGDFEEIHVMYKNGISAERGASGNIIGTYTLTVPATAEAGLSRLRIISDGIVCPEKWLTGYTGNNDLSILCGTCGQGIIGYAGSIHDLGVKVIKRTTGLQQPALNNIVVKGVANGISIESAGQTNVSVFSITGSNVCNQTINNNGIIEVPAGIYAIRANNQIFKVIVK